MEDENEDEDEDEPKTVYEIPGENGIRKLHIMQFLESDPHTVSCLPKYHQNLKSNPRPHKRPLSIYSIQKDKERKTLGLKPKFIKDGETNKVTSSSPSFVSSSSFISSSSFPSSSSSFISSSSFPSSSSSFISSSSSPSSSPSFISSSPPSPPSTASFSSSSSSSSSVAASSTFSPLTSSANGPECLRYESCEIIKLAQTLKPEIPWRKPQILAVEDRKQIKVEAAEIEREREKKIPPSFVSIPFSAPLNPKEISPKFTVDVADYDDEEVFVFDLN
eukprot:TRINITY_DN1083_c0_g2_i8.p1 TRINITY_DN1083_c0_g2~~TRINITY_DN1083_c0_g2_i8.p1  ORF type:complete len:276 (+),score=102.27 TRINITY_DN1083_c0_g2_i8:89-916(+)